MTYQRWRKIKKGQIIGLKKILRFRYKLGSHEYWDVKCLQCGYVTMLHIATIHHGRQCSECRKKLKPYINEAAYIAERKTKKDDE